mmetsp:Transcript_573/g.984  ORF Transcript_573/g.984 Transcript_573/m.984 type:complete len:104 (+) Transcript_573:527-838(+)
MGTNVCPFVWLHSYHDEFAGKAEYMVIPEGSGSHAVALPAIIKITSNRLFILDDLGLVQQVAGCGCIYLKPRAESTPESLGSSPRALLGRVCQPLGCYSLPRH